MDISTLIRNPVFYDYFGIIVFAYFMIDAFADIEDDKANWRAWIRLFIGIGGFIVDLINITGVIR